MNNKRFNDEYMMLGLNIRYHRRSKDYTQEKLAEAVNISREHLSKVETGVNAASLDVLFEISQELQVPINKFFEFKEK
ncbi:MAG: helix-turn-helix domain-containing protein [Defluviitaleaceae bacterium]|nr:helix-turn-helix domain-containing protein [Defluviitaleaceae bacterium]MCL2836110.1 helix-turn-helix domain-containing protein [Defluviitaleaceae bacterium]